MAYKVRQPYLQKRGNIYYFRVAVPKKLLHVFGRNEYKKSLKIEEYRKACCICSQYSMFVEMYFRLVEHMKPSSEDIKLLIRNHFEKCLMDAENSRWVFHESMRDGTANDNIETIIAEVKKSYQELLSLAQSQQYGDYQEHVARELLEWQDFNVPEASEEFEELAKGVMGAQLEAKRIEIAGYDNDHEDLNIKHPLLRDCHNYLPQPDYERYKECRHQSYHGAKAISLGEAIAEYLQTKVQENQGWRDAHKRYLGRLVEILGENCRLLTLKEIDGVKLEETIWKFPNKKQGDIPLKEILDGKHGDYTKLRLATVKAYWSSYKGFFAWCKKRELTRDNILVDVEFQKPKSNAEDEEGYRSFTSEELKAFFSSPLYTGHKFENQRFWKEGELLTKNGNYWVPLIGLFTGLREGEILYLQINDVRKDGNIYYIDVNKDDEGKKLKNKQSARKIPVHPELTKIGFLDYWEERKSVSEETDRLFDGITFPKKQKVTKNYSRNFSTFLKQLGLKKRKMTIWCFTHSETTM